MKTVAEIEITTEGILRNGSRMETTGTGSELLNNAYRHYVNDYPKFFKMDGPDNDLVFSFPLDGEMKVVNVGFHVYEDARGILGRHPSVRTQPGFAQIDPAWLGHYFR